MVDPGGVVSPQRAMEAYWNSPASDRGYPCRPIWWQHVYFRGEYLLWWTRGSTLTPWAGVADGGIHMNDGSRSGVQFTLGHWFDPCRWSGIEGSYLTLDTQADRYINGNATIDAASSFQGVEGLFRRALITNGYHRLDIVLGYRGLQLKDDFLANVQGLDVARINTRNLFNGFELGFAGRLRRYRWTLDMQMKLALGNTNIAVHIEPGGADFSFDEFAMVPELGVTVGYDLAPRLRATVGYTFLYWSMLARAGDQLDQVPAAAFLLRTTDYWAQGLNLGIAWQY